MFGYLTKQLNLMRINANSFLGQLFICLLYSGRMLPRLELKS